MIRAYSMHAPATKSYHNKYQSSPPATIAYPYFSSSSRYQQCVLDAVLALYESDDMASTASQPKLDHFPASAQAGPDPARLQQHPGSSGGKGDVSEVLTKELSLGLITRIRYCKRLDVFRRHKAWDTNVIYIVGDGI